MATSIMAMLSTNLKCLKYLHDEGPLFSIRDWVHDDDRDGILWVSSRGDMHETLKPLISVWMDTAVNALLTAGQSRDRLVWVILDELPSLHKLPSIQAGLAETRQFGGAFVIGFQLFSQLREVYGHDGANTVTGPIKRRLVLGTHDKEEAQWSAGVLGEEEVEEIHETMSYGAASIRDGVNLQSRQTRRALVLPSEVMTVPDLQGWLRVGAEYPICPVTLQYQARPDVAERLIERDLRGLYPDPAKPQPKEKEGTTPSPAKRSRKASESSAPPEESPPLEAYAEDPAQTSSGTRKPKGNGASQGNKGEKTTLPAAQEELNLGEQQPLNLVESSPAPTNKPEPTTKTEINEPDKKGKRIRKSPKNHSSETMGKR